MTDLIAAIVAGVRGAFHPARWSVTVTTAAGQGEVEGYAVSVWENEGGAL
jgi:hypothetical protein